MNTQQRHAYEQGAAEADLREILTEFWLNLIQDGGAEYQERLKASEMLAKYILHEGKTSVKSRRDQRPATTEVLRLIREMEGGDDHGG